MNNNVYVGNLPNNITEDILREMFGEYGQVDNIKLIYDRITGDFRGFGFIEMGSEDEAEAVIQELNGSKIDNNTIRVNTARRRDERPRGGNSRYRR